MDSKDKEYLLWEAEAILDGIDIFYDGALPLVKQWLLTYREFQNEQKNNGNIIIN